MKKLKNLNYVFAGFLTAIFFNYSHSFPQESRTGITIMLDSLPSSSIESPSYFKTKIDTTKPENALKTTQEIIGQTVGVDIDNFGGMGALSTVSIRGSASNQVTVLLDGTKLNGPASQTVDLSSVPANLSGSIEILRGGTSAEYGDGAIGGVINILPSYEDRKPESALRLSFGSFQSSKVDVFGNGKYRDFSYIFSASLAQSQANFPFTNKNNTPNNPDDDYTDTRINNQYSAAGVFSKFTFRASNESRFSLANELYYDKKGVPGNVHSPSRNANQRDFRDVVSIEYIRPGIFPMTDLSLRFSNLIDKLNFSDPLGELTGTALHTDQTSHSQSIDALFDVYALKSNLFTLKLGANYDGLDQIQDKSTRQKPYRINPYAVLKDQISLIRGHLVISPVFRFDYIYDRIDGRGDNGMVYSPKMGILGVIDGWFEIKSNLGTSYRYPSFNELYFNQGFIEGNTDLNPEKAINFDIGIKKSSRIFSGEIAYFLNRITDLIIYEQISNFRYKPINIDSSLTQGIELSLTLLPLRFIKINLNHTYMDPKNRSEDPNKNGKILPGRPQNRTNLRLTVFNEEHRLFSELQAISSNFVNEANTVKLGPRYILNCGYSYSLKKSADFNIEFKNILNSQIEDVRGFPLPGISFFAGVTLKIT